MTPAIYSIPDLYLNDTYNGVQFTLSDYETEVPIDLTNVDIKSEFRADSDTGTIVKTLIIGDGIEVTDAVNGVFRINAFTVDWTPGLYYYDIQCTFPGDVVKTYIRGTTSVIQDVTTTP